MQRFNLPFRLNNSISDNGYSQELREKKLKLDLYMKLRYEGCCHLTALEAIQLKQTTYYRWKKNYKQYGIEGLESKSREPHRKRSPMWSKDSEKLVLQVRKKYKLWGKGKISVILQREYGINLSKSTVGRIISSLLRRDLVKPVNYFFGRIGKRKKRVFTGHAKRWKYGMKSRNPGDLVQIDHATIRLISGMKVKHFKAVCPITKYVAEQAYTTATSFIGERFLQYIQDNFPFEIKSIQVDGGSEFMGSFEQGCKESSIDLFVLPPRRPQYNGTVERGHAIVKYEFYYQYYGSNNLEVIRTKLREYTDFYNTFRPHQRLNYETPMAYYQRWRL